MKKIAEIVLGVNAYAKGLGILFYCIEDGFQGRVKEILEGAPLIEIKIVHEINQVRLIKAVMVKELAHMRPVFCSM